MILSASGWRGVFAASGDENDSSPLISSEGRTAAAAAAEVFADFVRRASGQDAPVVVCAMDSRPTGPAICDAVSRVLLSRGVIVRFAGIAAVNEIMAYARKFDGFIYVSASHNPIGHNGIKFGLGGGGVLDAKDNAALAEEFTKKFSAPSAESDAAAAIGATRPSDVKWMLAEEPGCKRDAASAYMSFIKNVAAQSGDEKERDEILDAMRKAAERKKICVVADMNGSARSLSIDADFFKSLSIPFFAFNCEAGKIAHGIIPEGRNLDFCAAKVKEILLRGEFDQVIGYMPDCDGDRGNIAFADKKTGEASALSAQDTFALAVLSELSGAAFFSKGEKKRRAVVCNCATSMRIDEIAKEFGADVLRCEVGEANVAAAAREARERGIDARVSGEGSNGGFILHPSAARDPLSTVCAVLKILLLDGLFESWTKKRGLPFNEDFVISDVVASLPKFATTGASESRAILDVPQERKAALKPRFKKIFEEEWEERKKSLREKYGIASFAAVATNGPRESPPPDDWNNGSGGLKILFLGESKEALAFIWMRASGTENVFRILCDVKGGDEGEERELLGWESDMVRKACLP